MSNPIIDAVAALAAAKDLPISGITFLAPAVHGAGVLAINWSAFTPGCSDPDLPDGVAMLTRERVPEDVVSMPPLTDPQDLVIRAAWWLGAWDVTRTAMGKGYDGMLPPFAAPLHSAIQDQGAVTWYWRPMMRGPATRAKAHAGGDKTLNPWTLGREGEPPPLSTRPARAGTQLIIKLGTDPAARPRQMPRATARQRGYLGRLLRDAGQDDTLPVGLSMAEASAWIDRLRGPAGAVPRKPGRHIPSTANQWRLINSLLARLGRQEHVPLRMTYAESQEWIDQLKREIEAR